MKVTINIITDSQTSWGEPIACDDYDIVVYDAFTHIQLLRETDGKDYIIHEVNISHSHSYRLVLTDD